MSTSVDAKWRRAGRSNDSLTPAYRGHRKSLTQWIVFLHLITTIALTMASVPLIRQYHLPLRFAWKEFFEIYCIAFAFQGTLAAIIIYVIGFSPKDTVGPVLRRLWADKRRILMLIPFLLGLYLLCAELRVVSVWPVAAVLSIAILEVFDRTQGEYVLSSRVTTIALNASYLFWGLVLVSTYNDIAVVSRKNVAYDATFNRFDSWLMHGMTVSVIAHHAVLVFPHWVYSVTEFVYYSCMFPQVGAALLLLTFRCGQREAFRFVVAVLSAYYLAVTVFWLWPSQGPFFICQGHFSEFPPTLRTFSIQRVLSEKVASLWAGHGISVIGLDYYIAFPSMHIAIPTIVAFFLRRWKRIFYALLTVDALILAAVILLEWHYALDVIGGVLIAVAVTVLIPPRFDSCQKEASWVPTVTNLSGSRR